MAKFTYNERFTNVNKYDDFSNSYTGIKIASKLNQKNGEDYKLVDVTDLDWQGAWLRAAGSYINDTYELLEAIDNIADLAELEWVKNKINEHDVHITNIVNVLPSYITRNEFESIISQQQRALIPGSYIRIDSENVISTYDLLSISDAEDIYTTKEELNDFSNFINENYYDKLSSNALVSNVAYSYINKYVIKNADIRYNDLEKISNWILSQSKYVPVDYGDIDTENEKYFIYDDTIGEYIEVDKEYIDNHPDVQYYVEQQIIDDLTQLNKRVARLDETVGYVFYDEENNEYTYTGIINDVHYLYDSTDFLSSEMASIENEFLSVAHKSTLAYNTSIVAYDMAYYAYEMSLLSDSYAFEAYIMAYESKQIIGHEHIDGYYRLINEDELNSLLENPYSIQPLFTKENPEDEEEYYQYARYFNVEKYNNNELYYYVYVDPVESTGFYKILDRQDEDIKFAQYTAENILFNLGYNTIGTSYAHLDITPRSNDGTNTRTVILSVNEADIEKDNGEILEDGFITTNSLFNAFSYYSRFIDLSKNNN